MSELDVNTDLELEELDGEFEPEVITLLDEDGVEQRFELLDAVETERGRFLALTPFFEDPEDSLEDDGELIVLQVREENGEELLASIEDDRLLDEMVELFEERLGDLYEFEIEEE